MAQFRVECDSRCIILYMRNVQSQYYCRFSVMRRDFFRIFTVTYALLLQLLRPRISAQNAVRITQMAVKKTASAKHSGPFYLIIHLTTMQLKFVLIFIFAYWTTCRAHKLPGHGSSILISSMCLELHHCRYFHVHSSKIYIKHCSISCRRVMSNLSVVRVTVMYILHCRWQSWLAF